ncbi:T9SS type A sorting domain-containing protein [Flavobacteriaceae bacterium GSB9]|nr:T9SS type A sorting domain-containing protein [Flavobacteriaceae bacterium GSB9]
MATFLRFTFVIIFSGFQWGYAQNKEEFTSILNDDNTAMGLVPQHQNNQQDVESIPVNNEFKLYPNPLRESRVLTVSGSKTIQNIKIYSVLGKQLINSNFEKVKSAELNLKSINTGIYLVQINNKKTTRLILE